MKKKKKRNKKLPLFWKIFIAFTSLICVGFIVVWCILWSFLDSYEKSRIENTMDKIIERLDSGDKEFFKEYLVSDEAAFGTDDAKGMEIESFLTELASPGKWSYTKKAGEYSADRPVYALKKDGKKTELAVSVKKLDERGKFNTPKWEIEGLSGVEYKAKEYKIEVPDGYEVSVNGTVLSDGYKTEIKESEVLNNVTRYIEVPKTAVYTIHNVYGKPDIKVRGLITGKEQPLISEKDGEFVFGFEANEDIQNSQEERIKTITETYALYVLDDKKFGSISPYILRDSYAYTYLSNVSSINQWTAEHTKPEFNNMKVYNYQNYTDDCFSCEVSFDEKFTVLSNGNVQEYSTNIQYIFLKKNGGWYIVDVILKKA